MDWSCIKNETRFITKNCANLGTRREEKERSSVEKERCQMGFKTWTEAARIAIGRKRWKDTVKALYSKRSEELRELPFWQMKLPN